MNGYKVGGVFWEVQQNVLQLRAIAQNIKAECYLSLQIIHHISLPPGVLLETFAVTHSILRQKCPEMKPPAQTWAQFPTSFISCLLHLLSQHARTRVQCKFAIVQKETLYTLHKFSTWESQRVFLSFVAFFRLFWLWIILCVQTFQTKSTRRKRKRFEVSPWFRDNP